MVYLKVSDSNDHSLMERRNCALVDSVMMISHLPPLCIHMWGMASFQQCLSRWKVLSKINHNYVIMDMYLCGHVRLSTVVMVTIACFHSYVHLVVCTVATELEC